MTDHDGPVDPAPRGDGGDPPELDIDAAFAAIIADYASPIPSWGGPWPSAEDLDPGENPGPNTTAVQKPDAGHDGDTGPINTGPINTGPVNTGPINTGPFNTGQRPVESPASPDQEIRRIVLPSSSGGDDHDDDDLDFDAFVPPDPPPLPRGDLISRLAWSAVLGGPLFLLFAALAWRTLPGELLLTALLAFIAGFVTLVARMPAEGPDDEDDDGAVV